MPSADLVAVDLTPHPVNCTLQTRTRQVPVHLCYHGLEPDIKVMGYGSFYGGDQATPALGGTIMPWLISFEVGAF